MEIVNAAAEYVISYLEENLSNEYVFHDITHTKFVVEGVTQIGENSGLGNEELTILKLAAWFHDVGYAVDSNNHEEESTKISEAFLRSRNVEGDIITKVNTCILSTKKDQQPGELLSQILCDADMKHLADENYVKRLNALRKEQISLSGEKINKQKFYKSSISFIKSHRYYTDFAQQNFEDKKQENLKILQFEIQKIKEKKEQQLANANIETQDKSKAKQKPGYSRGVESMFRLTARNQINLSSIADNKSNILISVNALIMSILLTVLVSRFEQAPHIILPTVIFILFSLLTIIFAILSTRPTISCGTFTKGDIKKNKVNLLFFGNFYNMSLDDYEWAVEELMHNDKNLYSTMIKDQHALGKVLAKKYKLLRIAYNIFMVGLIISVLSFAIAFLLV